MTLLEVRGLKVHYPIGGGWLRRPKGLVRAVDGVDLDIQAGETLALVGESGCGKTTLGRAILGLVEPTEGTIRLNGENVTRLEPAALKAFRREVQMVFQDPFDSLNPRRTVFQTLALPLRIHGIVPPRQLRDEAARLLDRVGLSPGRHFLDRYPHQFSGGQRQRIGIARALAVRPRLIVADEAVSALDISIRAQILELLRRLQQETGLAYLFITHDLGVVRSLADRVAVMYLGKLAEAAPTEALFDMPRHPYTRALLAASPIADPVRARKRERVTLEGDVPSPANPPTGCRFHPRCPIAEARCRTEVPDLREVGRDRRSACHFAERAEAWRLNERRAAS
jgi:oligopeptide/dipeptide ABC transporter ATP-binding protein